LATLFSFTVPSAVSLVNVSEIPQAEVETAQDVNIIGSSDVLISEETNMSDNSIQYENI